MGAHTNAMIEALRNSMTFTGRTFGRLSGEVHGMHAAAYVLGMSAFVSSLLALFRDRLLAHTFGADAMLDLYYAAFRIPDFLFIIFGALVSVYVLIPALSGRSLEDQKRYIDTIIAGFSLLVCVVIGAAYILAPRLLDLLFPVIARGEMGAELLTLTHILLLQPVILALSNIVAAITQFKHRYILYALSPIVYNAGIILGIVALYPHFGLAGLALGVLIGAFLHLAIQLPAAQRDGFFRRMPQFRDIRGFMRTISVSVPRAAALSMSQLAFLGLLSFAGGLSTGSIAVFIFAFNLQAVPLAIIGASYSVAAFPTLASAYAGGNRTEFLTYLYAAARQILFWSLPAAALLIVLRAHVVRTVLGSGAFDWTDTRLTAAAVAVFALSLAAQGVSLLIVRASYAAGKTLMPFLISTLTAFLTIILGFIFLHMFRFDETGAFIEVLLRIEDVPGSDLLALILAYSAAAIVAALLHIAYFEIRFGAFLSEIARALLESVVAACVGGAAAYYCLVLLGDISFASTLGSVFFKGFTAGVVGIVAVALTYRFLGSREYAATAMTIHRRFWRDAEPVSSAEGSGVTRI